MFNWEDLNLPEYESVEDTKKRLTELHKVTLAEKGLNFTVEKGSPGFNPCPMQAREVAVMTALGLTSKEISLVLNIEEKLLKTYYNKEVSMSHNIANVMVARQALQMALSGRFPDMTKFWLKSRAKWKETSAMEISGPDGGPVEVGSARDKLRAAMGVPDANGG